MAGCAELIFTLSCCEAGTALFENYLAHPTLTSPNPSLVGRNRRIKFTRNSVIFRGHNYSSHYLGSRSSSTNTADPSIYKTILPTIPFYLAFHLVWSWVIFVYIGWSLVILGDIKCSCVIFGCLGLSWVSLGDLWWSWVILGDLDWPWVIFSNLGWSWVILGDLRLSRVEAINLTWRHLLYFTIVSLSDSVISDK